jgi:phage terminase large subunit
MKESGHLRIAIHQGGARSGKTYSIIQVLCEFCKNNINKGFVISIVRKTLPALKGSAYRDFIEILETQGWYDERLHNKSENTYTLFGNIVEFLAIDQPQKVRGRKRHICFINEANELTYEEFFQLNIRTTYKVIIDFNPSDEFSWIYDLEARSDAKLFVSNFTQNPYLDKELINELALLEQADPDYWNVFGLGLRGKARNLVYNHWQLIDEMPGLGDYCFAQDFGFNVPSATLKIEFFEGAVYWDEIIYAPKLITADLVNLYQQRGVEPWDPLYCDSAAADSIEELKRAGFNALKSNKDVFEGINKVKSAPLYITKRSFNTIKEIKNYKYMLDSNTNKPTEVPLKFNDHAMDAGRYGTYTHQSLPKRAKSYSV